VQTSIYRARCLIRACWPREHEGQTSERLIDAATVAWGWSVLQFEIHEGSLRMASALHASALRSS
jgi:hypothetical protein